MKRINEKAAAKAFVQSLCDGFYKIERSVNNEVVYQKEKEERDTKAVKEFVNTKAFAQFKEMI